MALTLDSEIRVRLLDYVAGTISLRDFEDWFIPHSWNVQETENAGTVDLVSGIELRLAEHGNGDWTEAQLRDHLREIVEHSPIVVGVAPARMSSTAQTTRVTYGAPRRAGDRVFVMAAG